MKREPYAAIIGAGRTKFDEHWCSSPEDLLKEAILNALNSVDKGVDLSEVNSVYLSSFLHQQTNKMGLLSAYFSREFDSKLPIILTESACASGGAALYNATSSILSGKKMVLVVGFEKMSDSKKIEDDMMLAADVKEYDTGFTFPALFASMMNRYIYKYCRENKNECREAIAKVACKNHQHALNNPYAQIRRKISVEDVLKSPLIADPIRLLDCCPVSDGAAAVLLVEPKIAKKYTDTPIYLVGSEMATDDVSLYSRKSLVEKEASKTAFRNLRRKCGIDLNDIQLIEAHDCFTIEEILFLEDIGFFERGKGWKDVSKSYDSFNKSKHIPYFSSLLNKEIIINAGGGLKADGHPLGATGLRQIYEGFIQLRGEGGRNQVDLDKDLNLCLTYNLGGTGGISTLHLLKRDLYE